MIAFKATVPGEFDADLRCTGGRGREPADNWMDTPELNEFTLCGKSWDEAKLRDHFKGDANKARAVWAFIEAVAVENVEDWEDDE